MTLYDALTGRPSVARLDAADLEKSQRASERGWYAGFHGANASGPCRLPGLFHRTAVTRQWPRDTPEIHLWDVLAGLELGLLEGHEGSVVSLLFSSDGKHLFSGGSDTTALTWDLTWLTGARRGSTDHCFKHLTPA